MRHKDRTRGRNDCTKRRNDRTKGRNDRTKGRSDFMKATNGRTGAPNREGRGIGFLVAGRGDHPPGEVVVAWHMG